MLLNYQFWSLLGVLLSLYFYFISINILSDSMSGPFWKLEKGISSIGTEFSDAYELPCGCSELDSVALQKHYVILTTELPLQPPHIPSYLAFALT